MDTEASAPTHKEPRQFGILAVLGVTLGVALAVLKALIWSGGTVNGEVFGYALAGVAIPGLIAFAVTGLGKKRNPSRFALLFSALSFFSLLLEIPNRPENLKDHVSRLVKEAAGTRPVEDSSSTETDRLSREMLHELLDLRKSHDTKTAQFKDDLSQLYSVDSFSSRAKMQRCMDSVRGTLTADQEFASQFQAWRDRSKEQVDQSSLSDSEKQDFMKGVNQSLGSSQILTLRNQVVEAETKWADATIDLYSLAMANTGKIMVDGSRIIINGEELRARFSRELEDAKKLRSDMRNLNSQMAQLQRQGMQEYGITRKDIGLSDEGQPPSH